LSPSSDHRLDAATAWLDATLGTVAYTLAAASGDASFRRYFRVTTRAGTAILMDAPPEKEDCRPFVALAERLDAVGVTVPRVIAAELEAGFLLLTDLGSTHYLSALSEGTRGRLYGDALDALLAMQQRVGATGLPAYDERLLRLELGIFREWYLGRHLGLVLGERLDRALAAVEDRLVRSALSQPRTFVHRDYHSRNLMVLPSHNPGILDFQGALAGPVTYDLVSLLRDCYIAWPPDYVEATAIAQLARMRDTGIVAGVSDTRFLEWLDLMGVQRHLKAVGIFARLFHRDGKPHYLPDIPRTLQYVREVVARRAGLEALGEVLDAAHAGVPA
jgi:hypothetical protein